MKTNTIIFGITMMLLLALPVAASDFTLDVFGNANEDDTINMQDVTYTELIILEYRDQTELSDGKHDGKINMQDVTQIELIILGKEKELTFLDIFGEAETVNKPIERLAQLGWRSLEMTRILDAEDLVICTGNLMVPDLQAFYPEISKLPNVGYKPDSCDFEKVLSLKPDAVMTNLETRLFSADAPEQKRIFKEKFPGIPLISLNMREQDVLSKNVRIYGYIIDREDEAEEFIDWFEGYIDLFNTRIEGLSEDEMPKTFIEFDPYECYASGNRVGQVLVNAGGKNIIDEVIGPDDPNYGGMADIDPEFIVTQNPEFIFIGVGSGDSGYATDDPTKMASRRQHALDRPELANINAVKNNQIYSLSFWTLGGAGNNIIGTAYVAKLLHPDLFADIDPQAVHQEYMQFHDIDYDIKEQGVFVYPPLEEI